MTQDANPQSRPLPKALLIVMPSSAALLALYNVLPFVEPWSWLLLGIVIVLGVVSIVLLARFVLQQRDDYWREHGRDPRNPSAPNPNDSGK